MAVDRNRGLGSQRLKAIYLANTLVIAFLVAVTGLAVLGAYAAAVAGEGPPLLVLVAVTGLFALLAAGLLASGLPHIASRIHRYRLEVTWDYGVEALKRHGLRVHQARLGLLPGYIVELDEARIEVLPVTLYTHRLAGRKEGRLPAPRLLLHLVPRRITPRDYELFLEAVSKTLRENPGGEP